MEQFPDLSVTTICNFLPEIRSKTMILFLILQIKIMTFDNTTDVTCEFIFKW